MEKVKRHRALLTALCTLSQQQCKTLLKKADKSQINCLSEIALNLLHNKLPVSPAVRSKLRKHKKQIRKLGNKRASLKERKKVAVQSGGAILPLLIPAALSLLGGLFGGSR